MLKRQFHNAMMNIYRQANSDAGYNAVRFLQMLGDHGGLETARILLHSRQVSEGYTALWERNRLDLTVEALILQETWHPLFSEQEREIAIQRLQQYDYQFPE